jgi:hypothetical protein
MNLGNNTAELLQNLSVIIAQRVALLKHNKNTDSQLQVAGKLDTPTPQIQKPSTEGIFHPEAKYFDWYIVSTYAITTSIEDWSINNSSEKKR